MTLASSERLRGELVRLLHRGQGVREFSMSAARIVSRAVPFDGVCVVTMDPATMLPTGEIIENGLPGSANARMIEIELGGEDFNSFRTLRRSGDIAAGLSDATGGDLSRSVRHRELKQPHGFGDELRAALVGDSATWVAWRCCVPPIERPSRRTTRISWRRCRSTSPKGCDARC